MLIKKEPANRKQDDDIDDQDQQQQKAHEFDDPFVMMLQNDQVAGMLSVSLQQFSMLLNWFYF